MSELLEYATITSKQPVKEKHGKLIVENWGVGELLNLLQQVGLEVDGTRMTLVKRVKEHLDEQKDSKDDAEANYR
jgi:hypothetical protein